ncbi:A-kinase anchor protein 7-like [Artemia franciscana]|uniref:A-kinase anchor protein 7-like n=1 Tax=Artemia franciscana TaxID=6661 RepID=UPI0032DB7365
MEKEPTLAKALIKQSSFHLTLKFSLLKYSSEVELASIEEFLEKILYAKLDNENIVKARLDPVLAEITKEITKSDVQLANQESWKPHLTLVDIRKVNKLRKEARKLHPSLSSDFKNMGFGRELVQSIQLLSMTGPKSKENYYEIISEIIFGQKAPKCN